MKPTPTPIPPQAGQESVWNYPRPPRLEATTKRIQVIFNDVVIADSQSAYRLLETSHPPTYYLPPQDVRTEHLFREESGCSLCEWKGASSYYSVQVQNKRAVRAAWCYHNPNKPYLAIKGYFAFYVRPMDSCLVDGEKAQPQPGPFYAGWVTHDIVGPFKGEPCSWWW